MFLFLRRTKRRLASLREPKRQWTTEKEKREKVIDYPNIDWILFIANLVSQKLPISIASGFAKYIITSIDNHHSTFQCESPFILRACDLKEESNENIRSAVHTID